MRKGFIGQTRTGYLGCVDISHLSPVIPSKVEESEVCGWRLGNDLGFFTPLRSVQNDREGAAFGMTGVKALRSE